MKYAKRRVLCIVLSLVVAITMAPYIGFADGEDVDWGIYAYEDQFSFTYDDIEEGKEFNLKPEIESDGDVDELGLTYQWYVSSGYDEETGEYIWNDIAGATGASYIAVMTTTENVVYKCVATDRFGNSDSCTFKLRYKTSGGDPFWKLKKPGIKQRLSKKNIKIYIQNGIKADKPFRATSSNSKVATAKIVNNSYVYVKFIKQGTATIKVTDVHGNSATCKVKVLKDNITKANFPDSIFRAYVKRNFDKNKDGYLSKTEIKKVKKIYMNNDDLRNLKGVGMFYNLSKLTIKAGLRKVNLSKNMKLKRLVILWTDVKYLNLSKNRKLEYVNLETAGVKSLKLPKAKKLKKLKIDGNYLKKLDISNCSALRELDAGWCRLRTIKIGKKNKLKKVNLCGNKIKKINLAKCPKLEKLDVGINKLKKLDLKKNRNLKRLDCHYNKLEKLYFGSNTKLKTIHCESNKLKKVDVRKCKKLKNAWIDLKTTFIKSGSWKKKPVTWEDRDGTIVTESFAHWYR